MSDYLAAEIFIGGPLPSRLVTQLCSVITAEEAALDWGEAAFHPESSRDLLAHRRNYHGALVLALCDDQARSGCFEQLEAFLIARRIPFDRYHEAKYEFDAELACYRPGRQPTVMITDADRKPIVRSATVARAQKQLTAVIAALEKQRLVSPLRAARSVERTLAKALPRVSPLDDFEIREEP